ncbi:MAG: hypothetical protein V1707_00610 [bacterium]
MIRFVSLMFVLFLLAPSVRAANSPLSVSFTGSSSFKIGQQWNPMDKGVVNMELVNTSSSTIQNITWYWAIIRPAYVYFEPVDALYFCSGSYRLDALGRGERRRWPLASNCPVFSASGPYTLTSTVVSSDFSKEFKTTITVSPSFTANDLKFFGSVTVNPPRQPIRTGESINFAQRFDFQPLFEDAQKGKFRSGLYNGSDTRQQITLDFDLLGPAGGSFCQGSAYPTIEAKGMISRISQVLSLYKDCGVIKQTGKWTVVLKAKGDKGSDQLKSDIYVLPGSETVGSGNVPVGLPLILQSLSGSKTVSKDSDRDGDTLSDYDEVYVWKTNPDNPDTDGDGYTDGLEVRNQYNPLGPGKLIPRPVSKRYGTVVKTAKEMGVYYVSDGVKRGFPSAGVFTAYGFKFSEVKVVSQKELDSYKTGSMVGYPVGTVVKDSDGNWYKVAGDLRLKPVKGSGGVLVSDKELQLYNVDYSKD